MEELNLDEMRSQIAILKDKVDKQDIVNDKLMHRVINTRTNDIKRKMWVAVVCGLFTLQFRLGHSTIILGYRGCSLSLRISFWYIACRWSSIIKE